jgi:hypothetical protein
MTFSPALLDEPLPFTIDLPRAVETHLYRQIAQDEHAASFVCRVMPASEKPATTFTLRFDGLDREGLTDYLKSEDDMIERLSYVDVYDVIDRAVCGDDVMKGFIQKEPVQDHHDQPLMTGTMAGFPVERALSSIVLASRNDGDATCDILDWVTYEDTLPQGTAIQTIPGNLEIWFHRGAKVTVERATPDSDGDERFNMALTFGMSIHVRDPNCFMVHVHIAS